MKLRKVFATAILAALFTTGCSKVNSTVDKPVEGQESLSEEIQINSACKLMTAERASYVFQEISDLKDMLNEGIQTMEHPVMIFSKETKEGDIVTVDGVFEADYTITRKPVDNPIIQGMYEAKESLKTKKEKNIAEEYIQGHLVEMEALYQKTERYPTMITLKFNIEDPPETYELFYPLEQGTEVTLEPLKQYAMDNWKEDAQARKEMGKQTLLENVAISMENP